MSSSNRLEFGAFSIAVGEGWEDITATVNGEDVPFTVARSEHGVGAVQFSPAIYRGGRLPSVQLDDLRSMLTEFGEGRSLNGGFDASQFSGDIFGIGSSFRAADDFVRVWYISDGKNVMLVTYVCDWQQRLSELEECEKIVRSVQFTE